MERYCENSIREHCSSNREILEILYAQTLENRQEAKISYRPMTVNPYVDMAYRQGIDLAKFFETFREGDYAYIACNMDGLFEKEMLINVEGECETEVWFNGKLQKLSLGPNGCKDAEVMFREGKNKLLIRAVATKTGFSIYARPLVPKLRMMPDCYVYYTRQYIETEGFQGQTGMQVSRLYSREEGVPSEENIEWIFPVMPKQSTEKKFDFQALCGKGSVAYVHTFIKGKIVVFHESPLKIFCEGRAIYCEEKGLFEQEFAESVPLLIKSKKGRLGWGFQAIVEGVTELPFVDGAVCSDLQWIWSGPYGREKDSIEYPYGPEKRLQFEEPYQSICAGMVYWKFYRPDTYLKQYLHSTFYGQWFYPMMVGLYGLKQAAEMLGKTNFFEYYMSGMQLLCSHRNYGVYDNKLSGWASYLPIGTKLDHLDPIGTIGINVAEYYMMSGDKDAKYLLQVLADSLTYKVPRFEDGTFYRNRIMGRQQTMWTDDMYMCLPFMVRLGCITGDVKYFDDIITQVEGFYQRMFMEEEGLYSHIYFVEDKCPNRIPWCRGNGWVLLALSEVLLLMPEEYKGYQTVLQVYKKFAEGILQHRDHEKGIWHQVLNNKQSYIETSGSAMFITALARGVKNGWLDDIHSKEVNDAWKALTERCIDADGNVYGICRGSGCNMDEAYYLKLQTIANDDHGVGIVLGAGVAVMEMLGER